MAFLASDIVKTVVKLWSIKVNAGHEFLPSGAIRDQHRKELGLEGLISITIQACVPDLCWDILKNFFFPDEFIDVWVFVTIQASVPALCWDIQYLKDFSNSNYMLSETGYYLSSLEMSAEYIKRLDAGNLDIVEGLPSSNTKDRFLLLPEYKAAEILLNWSTRNGCNYFEWTEGRERSLEGYQIVTSLEMIRDTSR